MNIRQAAAGVAPTAQELKPKKTFDPAVHKSYNVKWGDFTFTVNFHKQAYWVTGSLPRACASGPRHSIECWPARGTHRGCPAGDLAKRLNLRSLSWAKYGSPTKASVSAAGWSWHQGRTCVGLHVLYLNVRGEPPATDPTGV